MFVCNIYNVFNMYVCMYVCMDRQHVNFFLRAEAAACTWWRQKGIWPHEDRKKQAETQRRFLESQTGQRQEYDQRLRCFTVLDLHDEVGSIWMHSYISISSCFPSVQSTIYQNCSGDARFSHGASIARLLEWVSSVSDVSSGVCSITLLVHVGNLRHQPRQPPGTSAPLRSAIPLCQTATVLLCSKTASSDHILSSCLWSHGPANRYHADLRKEQAKHDEHHAEAGHELFSSSPWTPLPPPLIAAYLRPQLLRLHG